MSPWQDISPDEIYLRFYTLGYRERLLFYDKYVKENPYLDQKEKNEMAIDRLLALFEIGKYEKFLYEVDALIELVIEENIFRHNGEDAFCLLLFKKAASHFNLDELDAAKSILIQLRKISPGESLYSKLLYKIDRRRSGWQSPVWRSLIVLGYMAGFAIYVLDIFIIEPFAYKWHELASLSTELSLTLSTILLCYLCFRYVKSRW